MKNAEVFLETLREKGILIHFKRISARSIRLELYTEPDREIVYFYVQKRDFNLLDIQMYNAASFEEKRSQVMKRGRAVIETFVEQWFQEEQELQIMTIRKSEAVHLFREEQWGEIPDIVGKWQICGQQDNLIRQKKRDSLQSMVNSFHSLRTVKKTLEAKYPESSFLLRGNRRQLPRFEYLHKGCSGEIIVYTTAKGILVDNRFLPSADEETLLIEIENIILNEEKKRRVRMFLEGTSEQIEQLLRWKTGFNQEQRKSIASYIKSSLNEEELEKKLEEWTKASQVQERERICLMNNVEIKWEKLGEDYIVTHQKGYNGESTVNSCSNSDELFEHIETLFKINLQEKKRDISSLPSAPETG